MPRIKHPAVSHPVSLWRWLRFVIGDWMEETGARMVRKALYPNYDDEIPF